MIYPGIIEGAKKRDYNLIAFVGKSLNSPLAFENQENIIYKLANEKNIDGLLIASGAIGNFLTIEELTNFCKSYKYLPVVCLATPIKGIPSVWVDNKKGMRDIVTHFVKEHKYKRIAFIRGPSKNPEAEMRYNVFKEVLFENNIPLFQDLIFEGDFIWFSGTEAIKTILDKRKAKFDAVLAANDEMLIGVYRELIKRGIRIPEEVAIGGFDNIDETKIITPQITTVMQPFYEEGMKALELLDDIINGKEVKKLYTFQSRLIIRQSCGCKSIKYPDIIKNDSIYILKKENQKNLINKFQKNIILKKLLDDIDLQSNNPKEYMEYKGFIEFYLNIFINDMENNNNVFIENIVKLINNSILNNINLEFFRILFSKIYQNILPYLKSSNDLLLKAYNLNNKALLMVLDSISRFNKNLLIRATDNNWVMQNFTKAISTTFTLESLRDVIIELLPTLDISFCFIALYEKNNNNPDVSMFKSRVFLNYNTDNQYYNNNKLIFDTQQIIPKNILDKIKKYSLAIFPLVTRNVHFGYIAFDYDGLRNPIIYETIQGHISSSLNAAILIEKVKDQSMNILNQKNELSMNLDRLRKIMGGFINSMSILVETRDPYTAGHQVRVANLARAIATEMGLSKDKIEGIRVSGVLHDLGKIYIPSQILNKPGQLIDIELSLIKMHSQIGYNILKSIDFSWPVADIILQHHERIDGSGYPSGLKGNQILIEAQIISVADVVEAMASHRPYRPALGIDVALDEISKNKGKLYNSEIVDCCIKVFKEKHFNFEDINSTFKYPLSK